MLADNEGGPIHMAAVMAYKISVVVGLVSAVTGVLAMTSRVECWEDAADATYDASSTCKAPSTQGADLTNEEKNSNFGQFLEDMSMIRPGLEMIVLGLMSMSQMQADYDMWNACWDEEGNEMECEEELEDAADADGEGEEEAAEEAVEEWF